MNLAYSRILRIERPFSHRPDFVGLCDRVRSDQCINLTTEIVEDLSRFTRKINTNQSHGETMLYAKAFLVEMVQILPGLNFTCELYHTRSKFSKRKRKKLCLGEYLNKYEMNLVYRDYGRVGRTVAKFTTQQLLKLSN
jgi:hypothetical protein